MACAFDVPRVAVCIENDMQLKPPGKKCARAGLPHLPGGLQRSYSSPMALTCPGGWMDQHQQLMGSRGREYKDRQRATSTQSSAMATGEWGARAATIRPGTGVQTIAAPGGGHTQGARHLRPHTQVHEFSATGDRPRSSSSQARYRTGAHGFSYGGDSRHYNREKHGWHDPRGQAEALRLANPRETGSHAWHSRKARDHVGYGDDGVVNLGDIQVTATSGDGPTWFLGPKTVPGPFSTTQVPVRRCPQLSMTSDGKIVIQAKTYKQGPNLDVIETLHDGPHPPTPRRMVDRPQNWQEKIKANHPARRNNLKHGGCQTVQTHMPTSRHKTTETYDNGLRRLY